MIFKYIKLFIFLSIYPTKSFILNYYQKATYSISELYLNVIGNAILYINFFL